MATIFLSHEPNDREIANALALKLTDLGYEVIFDRSVMLGEELSFTIDNIIQTSDAVVIIVTQHSFTSSWTDTVFDASRAYNLATNNGYPVIPVIIALDQIPPKFTGVVALVRNTFHASDIAEQIHLAMTAFFARKAVVQQEDQKTQERIERNAGEYVEETIKDLGAKEVRFKRAAIFWYMCGFITLVFGVLAAVHYMDTSLSFITGAKEALPRLVFVGVKSVVIIGLLIAASKYSFNLGKSYMNEGLRNSDRIHAISFGRFYLRAYGEKATWSEIKEAFQYWNIDTASPFSKLDAGDIDPKLYESIAKVATKLASAGEKKKE